MLVNGRGHLSLRRVRFKVVNGSGLPDDPLQDPPTGLDYLSLAMLVSGPSSCHVMKLFNYPAPPSRGACSACVDPQALRGWKAAAGLPAGPVDKDWVAPDGWPVPDDATAAWQSVRGDEIGRGRLRSLGKFII